MTVLIMLPVALRFVIFREEDEEDEPNFEVLLAEVYTLSYRFMETGGVTNESVESIVIRIDESRCLFFNGALHHIAYFHHRKFILSFDVNDEKFREMIQLLNYLDGLSLMFEQLVVFKGLLTLIAFGKAEDEIGLIKECCIWVMREYSVVDSWNQIVVGPFQDEKFFGCTGSGELVFSRDLKILNKNNLGIEDLELKFYTADLMDLMESLVLLKE